jgi:hypothetical protein
MWDFRETLAIGDEATGTEVLTRQYEDMRFEARPTDLAAIWMQLGVKNSTGTVSFEESAPLAAVRRAIEAPLS